MWRVKCAPWLRHIRCRIVIFNIFVLELYKTAEMTLGLTKTRMALCTSVSRSVLWLWLLRSFVIGLLIFGKENVMMSLPDGFVDLSQYIPMIVPALRYGTSHNFLGRPVKGYLRSTVVMTQEAADALRSVADGVAKDGYRLVIYDTYRPQKAVQDFLSWRDEPVEDSKIKALYYPTFTKGYLFENGYISSRSTHSRGSTVDLTLIEEGRVADFTGLPKTKKQVILSDGRVLTILDDGTLDMESHFDLFDLSAHPGSTLVSSQARHNRQYLADVMKKNGFLPISTEWWHFSLKDEPFKDTYFDFDIQ